MKYNCRINKTPFVLWFTENKVLDIDFENNISVNENGLKSKIKKSNTAFIFLIKYLPVLLLFILGVKIPDNMEETLLFLGGVSIAFMMQYLFLKNIDFLKMFLVALFLTMYALLFFGFAYELESVTLYMVEVVLFFFIYREFSLKRYKDYYYLENFERKATVTLAKKRNRPIIKLWGDKGWLKKDTGFDLSKEFLIGGYFFRLDSKVEA